MSKQLNESYDLQNISGEVNLTNKFSKAYQDYQKELENKKIGLDPINILSDIESRTVDF